MLMLEDLWDGKLLPQEKYIRKDSEYQRLTGQLTETETLLRQDFTQEQKQLYDLCCMKQADLINIAERDSFIRGFRMGARMILDVLGKYHSQLPIIGEE